MFHSSADAIWSSRLSAYPDRFDNVDLTGDEVSVSTHVDIELSGGVIVGGFNCKVDMRHDGDDWCITDITYESDFGGPSRDFDVEFLRARTPDGTLRDLFDREILAQVDKDYNRLADEATIKARDS